MSVIVLILLGAVVVQGSPVVFTFDPNSDAHREPFDHYWKRSFGSGHALLATRNDWQRQLRSLREDLGAERVRFHGIFDDDLSTVLHTPHGYQFYNIDQIYGGIIAAGMKPIVELSFMPGLLARCSPYVANMPPCNTVMHYRGIVQPPANFSEWYDLVHAFGKHLISRFGIDEVRTWHFEVWNELWGMSFPEPYLSLYDHAQRALKDADPGLKVGGPVTMQCQWVSDFAVLRKGRYDFISTHLYPTDPNCTSPSSPFYGDIDCFANTIKKARSDAPKNVPFFLTEYNAGLFDAELLYSSYAAAFLFRNVPLLHGTLNIWSYWTFSDIFEEDGMHSAPFEGFNYGIQTFRGVKKPIYRAFQLLHRGAGATLVRAANRSDVTNANATVTAFGSLNSSPFVSNEERRWCVFVSNFAPQGFSINETIVAVQFVDEASRCSLKGKNATLTIIDAGHSDPHAAWVKLGRPAYPSEVQLTEMREASQLVSSALIISDVDGKCSVTLRLAPYSAALIEFS